MKEKRDPVMAWILNETTLLYYNQYLFERGIISQKDRSAVELAIKMKYSARREEQKRLNKNGKAPA